MVQVPDFDFASYGARLYQRRSEGVILRPAQASIGDWRPSQHNCHENVTTWCAHKPEHAVVRGWLYFDFEGLLPHVRFTAHSAIRTEDGSLVDITPSLASQQYPFIVAEEGEEAFAALIEGIGVQHLDYEVATGVTRPERPLHPTR